VALREEAKAADEGRLARLFHKLSQVDSTAALTGSRMDDRYLKLNQKNFGKGYLNKASLQNGGLCCPGRPVLKRIDKDLVQPDLQASTSELALVDNSLSPRGALRTACEVMVVNEGKYSSTLYKSRRVNVDTSAGMS
jgi:hypothetical protein